MDVERMKVKDIKAELQSLGAVTAGLFEKSEFVEALLIARQKAKEEGRSASFDPQDVNIGDDSDVATGQTTKMPKQGAGGGGMPGGGGGSPFGGMGGMGGMPGGMGGGAGGMGGLEDLLKNMGGGAAGGAGAGGAGGMGG